MAAFWAGEMCLYAVKRGKQWVDVSVVGFLGCSETTLVDAIVDRMVHPFVHSIDLGSKMLRIETLSLLVCLTKLRLNQIAGKDQLRIAISVDTLGQVYLLELCEEHANNLTRLIVDNRFGLFIPKSGNSVSPSVIRISLQVELFETNKSIQRISI